MLTHTPDPTAKDLMMMALGGRMAVASVLGRHYIHPDEKVADLWLTDLGPDLHHPSLALPPIKIVTYPFAPEVLTSCQDTPPAWEFVVFVEKLAMPRQYVIHGYVSRRDLLRKGQISQYLTGDGTFWPVYSIGREALANFNDLIVLHNKLRGQAK